jgi:hypothetical protein
VATFRIMLRSGLAAVQDSVRDLEATTRVVRNFQPGIIPGLLQTAEYARRIMALTDIGRAQNYLSEQPSKIAVVYRGCARTAARRAFSSRSSISVMRSASWRAYGRTQQQPAPRSRTVPACPER